MIGSAALAAGAVLPRAAHANVRSPYDWDVSPPTTSREAFIRWMVENRGENPQILAARWERERAAREREREQREREAGERAREQRR